LGLLRKTLPLLALDKIVRFEEKNIDFRTYDDGENWYGICLKSVVYWYKEIPIKPNPP
jgi:hypothetical protein